MLWRWFISHFVDLSPEVVQGDVSPNPPIHPPKNSDASRYVQFCPGHEYVHMHEAYCFASSCVENFRTKNGCASHLLALEFQILICAKIPNICPHGSFQVCLKCEGTTGNTASLSRQSGCPLGVSPFATRSLCTSFSCLPVCGWRGQIQRVGTEGLKSPLECNKLGSGNNVGVAVGAAGVVGAPQVGGTDIANQAAVLAPRRALHDACSWMCNVLTTVVDTITHPGNPAPLLCKGFLLPCALPLPHEVLRYFCCIWAELRECR